MMEILENIQQKKKHCNIIANKYENGECSNRWKYLLNEMNTNAEILFSQRSITI